MAMVVKVCFHCDGVTVQFRGATFWVWFDKSEARNTRRDDVFGAIMARESGAKEDGVLDGDAQSCSLHDSGHFGMDHSPIFGDAHKSGFF